MSILSRRNAASNMSALVLMLPRGGNYGRRILKEPIKIHADSFTMYSSYTHVSLSLSGPNFGRIYKMNCDGLNFLRYKFLFSFLFEIFEHTSYYTFKL
jgi:hypothetical protein